MEGSFDLQTLLQKHKRKFKNKPTEFSSTASGVQKRLKKNLKDRKNTRSTVFDRQRDLPELEIVATLSETEKKVQTRREQLEKWKEERNNRKRELALLKKKPFIMGVVHVPLKFELPPPVKPKPTTSRCVTRSQTANIAKQKKDMNTKPDNYSFAPIDATFRPPEISVNNPKNTSIYIKNKRGNNSTLFQPILPTNKTKTTSDAKTNSKSKIENVTKKTTQIQTTAKSSKPTTVAQENDEKIINTQSPSPFRTGKLISAPETIVVSPSSESKSPIKSTERLDNELTPINCDQNYKEVIQISPCVTVSRGKENARREMKKKIEEGLLDDDVSDMHYVDQFRRQLASEIKRMTEMCEVWDKIYEQTQLPEAVQEAVLTAVGQARLLMSQKLVQFGSLVEQCARPDSSTALVTPADLHGFWDMVFMQIENVDVRFQKLEKLRKNGWVEEHPVEVIRKVVKAVVKKPTKPAGGPSRLKEMIAAARRAKKEQEHKSTAPEVQDDEKKTFEAGFFRVQSPVRSPAIAIATPSTTPSLLKAVLSSEAKRASASKRASLFAMLRASLLGKSMEYDGIALLPQTPLVSINLDATPARSILKSAKTSDRTKSIKVVLFNKSGTDILDKSDSDIHTSFTTQQIDVDDKNEADCKQQAGTLSPKQPNSDTVNPKNDHPKKEITRKKSKVTRHSEIDLDSPICTRSMSKCFVQITPVDGGNDEAVKAPRSSRRSSRKVLKELEVNQNGVELHETPRRRSSRRRNSVARI